MKTYEDLQAVSDNGLELGRFIMSAITDHKSSTLYNEALIARQYFRKQNTTIINYQKLLYKLSGEAVPDNWSANHKVSSAFLHRFIVQENYHLLGNGVTFNNDSTKDRLGGDKFDEDLIQLGEYALWGGVGFGFLNLDHIDVFSVLEFAPLFGEEDGALKAGIRFWQLDDDKPMRVTLYELDGYTDYRVVKGQPEIIVEKRAYKQIVQRSEADGVVILDGENYPSFPIVPLWGNSEHQSELIGIRSGIDCYDLIKSGFANDLDDASQIYWVIQNADGMDDVDLSKFIERMKTVKAAAMDDDVQAEAHTIEVPYNAREAMLDRLRSDLYEDAMALDTKEIAGGAATATAIRAAYENLTLKCDGYETCVTTFIRALLDLLGIDDSPSYKRSKIVNMQEDTQTILSAAQYLDDETILRHLPFLNPDEIDDILKRVTEEEAERLVNDERNRVEGSNGEDTEVAGNGNIGSVQNSDNGDNREVE